jgi:alginate O-acetyltransferase complex protein AlgI
LQNSSILLATLAILGVTACVGNILARHSRGWIALLIASLVFYGFLRPKNLPLVVLLPFVTWSLFAIAMKWRVEIRQRAGLFLLVLNLAILALFKYSHSFAHFMGQPQTPTGETIIPLGLSFIVFRLVSYVLDVRGGETPTRSFGQLLLYSIFFPAILAGPLIRFEPFARQMSDAGKIRLSNLAVGLTLISFGLFKNLIVAPWPAGLASNITAANAAGIPISIVTAWAGAVAYGLEIYFDFSGYSDAAIGVARIFAVQLPANFHSPYKAHNLVDFWQRWHVSLTRLLILYVYNPLALTAARHMQNTPGRIVPFVARVAFPSMCVMVLMGIWHGQRLTFLWFGLYHGVVLVINHIWRTFGGTLRRWTMTTSWWPTAAHILTLAAVMASWVIFQAPTSHASWHALESLVGTSGVTLPVEAKDYLGPVAELFQAIGIEFRQSTLLESCFPTLRDVGLLFGLMAVVLLAPNTNQMLLKWDPVLSGFGYPKIDPVRPLFTLRFNAAVGGLVGLILSVSILTYLISDRTTVIYFRF